MGLEESWESPHPLLTRSRLSCLEDRLLPKIFVGEGILIKISLNLKKKTGKETRHPSETTGEELTEEEVPHWPSQS